MKKDTKKNNECKNLKKENKTNLKVINDLDKIKKEKKEKDRIEKGLYNLLVKSIKEQDIQLLKEHLKNGIKANYVNTMGSPMGEYQTSSAIHEALSINNIEIIKILLDAGADVNAIKCWRSWTGCGSEETAFTICLKSAITNKSYDIVELFINHRADVNYKVVEDHITKHSNRQLSTYPIFMAVNSQDINLLKILLNNKADVNLKREILEKNDYGKNKEILETVLHVACSIGNLEIVKMLVNYGADINILKHGYETGPSNIVSKKSKGNNYVNIKILLNPLHIACKKGKIEIVNYLFNNGCMPNDIERDGKKFDFIYFLQKCKSSNNSEKYGNECDVIENILKTWNKQIHRYLNKNFKDAVSAILFIRKKRFSQVKKELLYIVFGHLFAIYNTNKILNKKT